MRPYYIVENGQIRPRRIKNLEIDSSHYEVKIETDHIAASVHEAAYGKPSRLPLWIVDVTFGTYNTILCFDFGQFLTTMNLLANIFPNEMPGRHVFDGPLDPRNP